MGISHHRYGKPPMSEIDDAVDYVAELSLTKARTAEWINELTTTLDGLQVVNRSEQQRVAIALHGLSMDHYLALCRLIDLEMLPSAKALYRPQVEAYIRGLWFHFCASEKQLKRFLDKDCLPQIGQILEALERHDADIWGALRETKEGIWKRLCDETHGGRQQVLSRFANDEIGRCFSAEEAFRFLLASTSMSCLAAIGMAAVIDDTPTAQQLRTSYYEIFTRSPD